MGSKTHILGGFNRQVKKILKANKLSHNKLLFAEDCSILAAMVKPSCKFKEEVHLFAS